MRRSHAGFRSPPDCTHQRERVRFGQMGSSYEFHSPGGNFSSGAQRYPSKKYLQAKVIAWSVQLGQSRFTTMHGFFLMPITYSKFDFVFGRLRDSAFFTMDRSVRLHHHYRNLSRVSFFSTCCKLVHVSNFLNLLMTCFDGERFHFLLRYFSMCCFHMISWIFSGAGQRIV